MFGAVVPNRPIKMAAFQLTGSSVGRRSLTLVRGSISPVATPAPGDIPFDHFRLQPQREEGRRDSRGERERPILHVGYQLRRGHGPRTASEPAPARSRALFLGSAGELLSEQAVREWRCPVGDCQCRCRDGAALAQHLAASHAYLDAWHDVPGNQFWLRPRREWALASGVFAPGAVGEPVPPGFEAALLHPQWLEFAYRCPGGQRQRRWLGLPAPLDPGDELLLPEDGAAAEPEATEPAKPDDSRDDSERCASSSRAEKSSAQGGAPALTIRPGRLALPKAQASGEKPGADGRGGAKAPQGAESKKQTAPSGSEQGARSGSASAKTGDAQTKAPGSKRHGARHGSKPPQRVRALGPNRFYHRYLVFWVGCVDSRLTRLT